LAGKNLGKNIAKYYRHFEMFLPKLVNNIAKLLNLHFNLNLRKN